MLEIKIDTFEKLRFACNRFSDEDIKSEYIAGFWDLYSRGVQPVMFLFGNEIEKYNKEVAEPCDIGIWF